MKFSTLTIRTVCLFFLSQFAMALQALAYESVSWVEESLIHDGRLLKVERKASNSLQLEVYWPLPPVFRFQSSGFDEYRIEFRHPDTNERVVWSGERGFTPVRVDVINGIPYLVIYGRPNKQTEKIYGCPELPYIYLKYHLSEWSPVPLEQAPRELAEGNLSVYDVRAKNRRSLNWKDVEYDVKFYEEHSYGQMQARIPRSYDEWHTKFKNGQRNERQFGDCRPPPKPLPDAPLPKPGDVDLEVVSSSDNAVTTSEEYYKSLWDKVGQITRARCAKLFKPADKENVMAGELFVGDPTGTRRLPYTGAIPYPTGRMLEQRTVRYCNDEFVWFVAELEEPEKIIVTKYSTAGDFVYSVRFSKPKTADVNLPRNMVVDSFAEDGTHVAFFWYQSLPTVDGPPKKYWSRMTRFRFKEPVISRQ